jgi:hypothetical protein
VKILWKKPGDSPEAGSGDKCAFEGVLQLLILFLIIPYWIKN